MTGYASAQSGAAQPGAEAESNKAPRLRIGVEIRSVNSRFLDLAFRLPEELRQHEPALRNLLNGRLKRGKVELRAAIETPQTAQVADPSPRLLQRLNAVQDQVLAWLPGARPLSVADVIRLASAEGQQPGDLGEQLLPLAGAALAEMISAREREGHRLAGMLTGHLVQLRALAAQAMPLVPQLVDQQRQRFLARWQEAMGLANPASGDLALPSDAAQDRALLALIIGIYLVYSSFGIAGPFLWGHHGYHGATYAQRARMTLRYHIVTPATWNGYAQAPEPQSFYLHHPIGYHHVLVPFMGLLGEAEWVVRGVAVLGGVPAA